MNIYGIFAELFALFALCVGGIVLLVVGLPMLLNHWRSKKEGR